MNLQHCQSSLSTFLRRFLLFSELAFYFSLSPNLPHPNGALVPRGSKGNQWSLLKFSLFTTTVLPFIFCNSSPFPYSDCACNLRFHTILDHSTVINITLNIPQDKTINETKACFEPVSSSTFWLCSLSQQTCRSDDLFRLTLCISNVAFNWALVSLLNQGH